MSRQNKEIDYVSHAQAKIQEARQELAIKYLIPHRPDLFDKLDQSIVREAQLDAQARADAEQDIPGMISSFFVQIADPNSSLWTHDDPSEVRLEMLHAFETLQQEGKVLSEEELITEAQRNAIQKELHSPSPALEKQEKISRIAKQLAWAEKRRLLYDLVVDYRWKQFTVIDTPDYAPHYNQLLNELDAAEKKLNKSYKQLQEDGKASSIQVLTALAEQISQHETDVEIGLAIIALIKSA